MFVSVAYLKANLNQIAYNSKINSYAFNSSTQKAETGKNREILSPYWSR